MTFDCEDREERRKGMFDKEFYDKMMEVHADLKHMVKWSSDHDVEDDTRFKDANKKIDLNMKFMYMAMGGIVVIQFVIHLIK